MYIFEYKVLIKNLVMLVLYLVFNNVFQNNQEHFALYLLIGLTSWRFFALGTSMAMSSIVGKSSLVTKIYLP
jgi:lipopolysaccharide transport system permease protein